MDAESGEKGGFFFNTKAIQRNSRKMKKITRVLFAFSPPSSSSSSCNLAKLQISQKKRNATAETYFDLHLYRHQGRISIEGRAFRRSSDSSCLRRLGACGRACGRSLRNAAGERNPKKGSRGGWNNHGCFRERMH